jgi:pimeloyl-ACP methyl ester carboxylesterase
MSDKVFLLVPGINTFSSQWGDWPNKGCAYINQYTPFKAQPMLYTATAISGYVRHSELAKNFGDMLSSYIDAETPIEIIAHSNGTRIVLETLANLKWPRIEALNLVCAAADGNMERNGANQALRDNKLGAFRVFIAGEDSALRFEDMFLNRLLFGVRLKDQPLGLSGPQDPDSEMLKNGRISERWWPTFGHSTCWQPKNFQSTMHEILNPDA